MEVVEDQQQRPVGHSLDERARHLLEERVPTAEGVLVRHLAVAGFDLFSVWKHVVPRARRRALAQLVEAGKVRIPPERFHERLIGA